MACCYIMFAYRVEQGRDRDPELSFNCYLQLQRATINEHHVHVADNNRLNTQLHISHSNPSKKTRINSIYVHVNVEHFKKQSATKVIPSNLCVIDPCNFPQLKSRNPHDRTDLRKKIVCKKI